MAYGDQYGENYGGTETNTEQPEEPKMNVLELNDYLVITMKSQMQGTKQDDENNLYVHIHTDNTLTLVQQGGDGTAEVVAITAKGIDLLRRVLASLPIPQQTEPTT